jgi:hypothetical protein
MLNPSLILLIYLPLQYTLKCELGSCRLRFTRLQLLRVEPFSSWRALLFEHDAWLWPGRRVSPWRYRDLLNPVILVDLRSLLCVVLT